MSVQFNEACQPGVWTICLHFLAWVGAVIRSLFPWPALVLFVFVYRPLRDAIASVVTSLAESMRMLRQVKVAGVELTLDPQAAREMQVKSTALVLADYKRRADKEVIRLQIGAQFRHIVKTVVAPQARHGFRATIHIEDAFQTETLYQLIEYEHVSEPQGPPETRGRRSSIRFGIIGRAWRLGLSQYDRSVSTDPTQLVKDWGMTRSEADRAGYGRRSFAAVLLRDQSGGPSGLIFIDATEESLFDDGSFAPLVQAVNAIAAQPDGLSDHLAQIRNVLAQEFRVPSPQ